MRIFAVKENIQKKLNRQKLPFFKGFGILILDLNWKYRLFRTREGT